MNKEEIEILKQIIEEIESNIKNVENITELTEEEKEEVLKRSKIALKAIRKQVPKNPICSSTKGFNEVSIPIYYCPECNKDILDNYCPNCGQALKFWRTA